MTDQLSDESLMIDPASVVERFLDALRQKDLDAVRRLLSDDAVYQNVGYSNMHGGSTIAKWMRRWLELPGAGFDVKIHRIATEGSAVLTERTDLLAFGPFEMHIWICGVFEVRGDQVTLWRDYLDIYDFVKAAIRGLAAIAIPSLRRSF
jgi:limonene-1,2-epoxide hydrolase